MVRQAEAYVAQTPKHCAIEKVTYVDDLAEDELWVKIVSCGVCHADIKAINGQFALKPPMIPGHESAGIVEEVGKGVTSRFQKGDHIVMTFAYCGECKVCVDSEPAFCDKLFPLNYTGKRTNGQHIVKDSQSKDINGLFFAQSGFATHAIINANSAVKLPTKTLEELQFSAVLTCGVMTGASTILEDLKPRVGSTLAIWGAGSVGIAAACAAKVVGCDKIILVDMVEDKLALAKELAATHTINAKSEDVKARILEITNGKGVDFACDAVGSERVLTLGLTCLATRGTLITIGATNDFNECLEVPIRQMLLKGLTYRGTHQGNAQPARTLPLLYKLWKSNQLPIERITTKYNWRELDKVLHDLENGKVVKGLLIMD